MAEEPTSYFRYEEVRYGTGYTDVHGEYVSTGSYVELQLREFRVIRRTPCGVRIDDYRSEHGRFISREWNKQWACPTVEEARLSFIARKERQIRILRAQLKQAKEALGKAAAGHCPTEVGWLVPRPPWARGSDPTAEVARVVARDFEHRCLQDYVSG